MAGNEPATSVGALVAKVTQSITNINAHREAMAQVAAQAKITVPAKPAGEVSKS